LQVAARRPDLVGHLVLVSLVETPVDVPATHDDKVTITLIRGENDGRPLDAMLSQIESVFGPLAKENALVHEFKGEGHVIRRAPSWAFIHGVGFARLQVPALDSPSWDQLEEPPPAQ
jgi:hypothetical protein